MNKQKAIEMAKELGPEYKYVAMDVSRWWHAYKTKPVLDHEGYWYDCPESHKILFYDDICSGTLTKVYGDE